MDTSKEYIDKKSAPKSKSASHTIFVDSFTDGVLDPKRPMLGPVRDGGIIIANTAPGCWGPMITPALHGGHEVTQPVSVEGAEPGDAIAIKILSIQVTSMATASGNDKFMKDHFVSDPYVDGKCPECGTINPETRLEGIGATAVRCVKCGANVTPFQFTEGYTIAFDKEKEIGITLPKKAAEKIGKNGREAMCLPQNSTQHPIVSIAPHDMPGTVARFRPFLGQLGTTPGIAMPDSHNAGDFGLSLIGAAHDYALTKEQLSNRTDGHMDVNRVREGATLICPVKTSGGGIYMGDMHAMQGNGEIAGHTTDVAGIVTLEVHVIKNANIEGPILLPVLEDLPYYARPITKEEKSKAEALAQEHGFSEITEVAPISFIGTGGTINEATDNGMERASKVLGISLPEVMNRSTITGSIDVGRLPGVATVTFLAPVDKLKKAGIYSFIKEQYG